MAQPRALYITTYPVDQAPHGEWLPWLLSKAGWHVECWAPGAEQSVLQASLPSTWAHKCLYPKGASPLKREAALLAALVRAWFGHYHVVILDSTRVAYRAALLSVIRRRKVRLVYQARDFVDPLRYHLKSRLEGLLLRHADLHVNHEYHRAYIYKTLHRFRCPVVLLPPYLSVSWPVPSPDEQIRKQLAGSAGENAFLVRLHGGYSELRRTSELLEALTMLPERFRLIMTADPQGRQGQLATLVDSYGLSGRVVALPWLDFPSMLGYTVCCDVGVLLYANNDLGNFFQSPGRLTEYLACGLPVIASNFTGLKNLVTGYRIGVPTESSDPRSIAQALLEIERLRRSGEFSAASIRRRFEQNFALENWGPTLVEAFELLVSQQTDSRLKLQDGWLLTAGDNSEPWAGGARPTLAEGV